jgi:hypothetical protein
VGGYIYVYIDRIDGQGEKKIDRENDDVRGGGL